LVFERGIKGERIIQQEINLLLHLYFFIFYQTTLLDLLADPLLSLTMSNNKKKPFLFCLKIVHLYRLQITTLKPILLHIKADSQVTVHLCKVSRSLRKVQFVNNHNKYSRKYNISMEIRCLLMKIKIQYSITLLVL